MNRTPAFRSTFACARELSPELPLDHEACIEANLRYAHAQSGSPLAFEVAIRIPHVLRCLENAVHANHRKVII